VKVNKIRGEGGKNATHRRDSKGGTTKIPAFKLSLRQDTGTKCINLNKKAGRRRWGGSGRLGRERYEKKRGGEGGVSNERGSVTEGARSKQKKKKRQQFRSEEELRNETSPGGELPKRGEVTLGWDRGKKQASREKNKLKNERKVRSGFD